LNLQMILPNISATVFDDLDVVLKGLIVLLAGHVAVLRKRVIPPLCFVEYERGVPLGLELKHLS